MKNIIGIDNGLDGGIAVLSPEGEIIDMFLTPTVKVVSSSGKQHRRMDVPAITSILNHHAATAVVALEYAQAMPGQGVVAMFSTGYGYGMYQGIVTALGMPYEIVRVNDWQKKFGITGMGARTKDGSYLASSRIWPQAAANLKTPRGRIYDGVCDALLIAEYYRRNQRSDAPLACARAVTTQTISAVQEGNMTLAAGARA